MKTYSFADTRVGSAARKLLLGLMLLAIPACGVPAHAQTPDRCIDSVANEVIFDFGLEPMYTFPEGQAKRIQKAMGTNSDVDWTSIDVLYKPGSPNTLVLFKGRLPGSKQICIFDYSTSATITDIEKLMNALEAEGDD